MLTKLKQNIQKRYKLLIVIVLVIGFIAWLTIDLMENLLKPRVIIGKSEIEIVTMFYNSINNLDHDTMSDCVIGSAGRKKINEVITVSTISMMGNNSFTNAQQWIDQGKPAKDFEGMIYGIANFKIDTVNENTFIVYYEKWSRDFPEDISIPVNDVICVGERIKEEISFTEKKDFKAISSIKVLEEVPLKFPD